MDSAASSEILAGRGFKKREGFLFFVNLSHLFISFEQ